MLWGRRVHSGSLRFTQARLAVAGFIGVPLGSLMRALGSQGSFGIAWVHSGPTFGLFDFAWVYSGTPWSRRIHSGSRGFTPVCRGVSGFIGFGVSIYTLGLDVVAGFIGFRVDSLVPAYGSMGLSGFA